MSIKGFTPAVDSITEKHGIITSVIYGRIWRFAQMSELKICTASQSKIGEYLGLDRATVNKHIKTLKDNGFLSEVGRVKGGTVTYAPLINIVTQVSIEAEGCNLEQHPPVIENDTKKEYIKKDNTVGDFLTASLKDMPPTFDDYPPDIQLFCQAFYDVFKRAPTTKKEKDTWIAGCYEIRGVGAKPSDIKPMYKHCKEQGLAIKSPFSITFAYDELRTGEPKREQPVKRY